MKILFLCDSSSIHSKKYIDYFVDKDYLCKVLSFSKDNISNCTNFERLSKRIPKRSGKNIYYLTGVFKIINVIKKFKPDQINCHFSYSYGFLGVISKMLSFSSATISIVCHGSDILDPPMKYICKILNYIALKKATKIIAVSNQIYEILIKNGIPQYKILCLQYGVIIKEYTEKERYIDIISIREMNENTRVKDLIYEFKKSNISNNLKCYFCIPNLKNGNFDEIKNINSDIQYLLETTNDNIIELLKSSKIYISATKSDGLSISLIEAMYYGAIPIVSNIYSNRIIIKHDENGYLFDNIDEIKYYVNKINCNIDRTNRIRDMNKKIVEKNYNYKNNMKKIEQFLILKE